MNSSISFSVVVLPIDTRILENDTSSATPMAARVLDCPFFLLEQAEPVPTQMPLSSSVRASTSAGIGVAAKEREHKGSSVHLLVFCSQE